jgi:large subunit ribosomal protein L16
LQPRHFFYKRKQKNRKMYSFKNKSSSVLKFGSSGLRILQPVHLTSKHLFRLKLFLKRASRKSDYTKRFVWFHAFPHLPLTKKPTGTRMGKGKGKLECWFTNVQGGAVLFEFKNLRRWRSLYFFKQLTHKLGITTKFCFNSTYSIPLPLSLSKKTSFKAHW